MKDKKIEDGIEIQKITLNLDRGDISAGEEPIIAEERITDHKKILSIIQGNLKASFKFVLDNKNPSKDQFIENGLLHTIFKISDVYSWINGDGNSDSRILTSLDEAVKSGALKIFIIEHLRSDSIFDISFGCEIGKCEKNYKGQICLQNIRFYSEEPLKKEEFDEYNLQDISGQVKNIRDQIDAQLSLRHGKSGLETELQLRKEEREERIDLQRRMCGLQPKENEK